MCLLDQTTTSPKGFDDVHSSDDSLRLLDGNVLVVFVIKKNNNRNGQL